jgi:hypothetical protein
MIPQSEINEAAQFLTDKSGANPSHAVLCEECVRLRRENEELREELALARTEHTAYQVPVRRPLPEPAWIKLSDQPPTYPCFVRSGLVVDEAKKPYSDSSELHGRPLSTHGTREWDRSITHWMPKQPKPAPPVSEKSAEDEAFEKFVMGRCDPLNLEGAFKAGIEFARKGEQ